MHVEDNVEYYLSTKNEYLEFSQIFSRANKQKMKQMKFIPLEDELLYTKRKKAVFQEKVNIEESYIITKVSSTEQEDLFYLR